MDCVSENNVTKSGIEVPTAKSSLTEGNHRLGRGHAAVRRVVKGGPGWGEQKEEVRVPGHGKEQAEETAVVTRGISR